MENTMKNLGSGRVQERKLHDFGVYLSLVFSAVMRFIGIVALTIIDVALGGFTLTWLMSQLTPEGFRLAGTAIAWSVSVILFTMVSLAWKWQRSVDQKKDATKTESFASLLLPLFLNALDSIIDATAAIIIFGQGFNLTLAGMSGFNAILDGMPLVGWVVFFILFSISFFGELCRIILEEGQTKNRKSFSDFEQ